MHIDIQKKLNHYFILQWKKKIKIRSWEISYPRDNIPYISKLPSSSEAPVVHQIQHLTRKGMAWMTITVWGTNLYRLHVRSNITQPSTANQFFKKKGTPNVYFVLRKGNQMKRDWVTLKSLWPSLVFFLGSTEQIFVIFNLVLLWEQLYHLKSYF